MSRKLVIALTLSSVALASQATDRTTANLNAESAKRLVSQGKYAEAFTEIGWLLRDSSPEIREYAEDVLKKHPIIATTRLEELSLAQLTEMACEYGVRAASEEANAIIRDIGPFADRQVASEARSRVGSAYANPEVTTGIEKCVQAQEALSAEDRRLQAIIVVETTKQAPAKLRELDDFDFCIQFGSVLRAEPLEAFKNVENLPRLFAVDAKRRGVSIAKDLVLKQRIRVGINRCTLYASWGQPNHVNRSVGAWGTHSQLVYGQYGPYVYITNGVVRSFQD